MDSGKIHEDEADIFDPAGAQARPVSLEEHIETETNVFSVDSLRRTGAQHGGGDTGSFEVSAPSNASSKPLGAGAVTSDDSFEPPTPERPVIDTANDALDDLDPLDDDFPKKKGGFFAKLFGRGARNDEVEEDLDDLSLDDDMFIAPPPASERAAVAAVNHQPPAAAPAVTDSGVFEFKPPTVDEAVSAASDEPEVAATVPEVTDSGVFEFNPPAADEAVPAASNEPEVAAAVPEVTDSGVFEFNPSSDEAAPVASNESDIVATVPEVTDSGVFEFNPSANEAVSTATNESEIAAAVPEVTDSGVFELSPPAAATVPEVTDSGVFELGPSSGAPSSPQGARKDGDEWEIGWEPEDEVASAEFDVSGATAASSAATAAETPPPVFTKLAHVCLYVEDLGRSVEFYSKLGFQKRFVFNRNGKLFGVYLEFGGGNFIELFEDASRSAAAAPGRLAHFCLETPDIDAATESLSARGIGFSPKKLGCDSTYQIWLKDPDGNEFEIHQYTENSSQIVGGEVEADW